MPAATPADLLAHVEEILASRAFRGSGQLQAFLRYAVRHAVEHPGEQLKEVTIATEVLGCRPDYDPNVDSVVRVHASRLRQRLDDYYAGEGAGQPIRVQLPKGAYSASWTSAVVEVRPVETPPAVVTAPRPDRRWMLATFAASAAAGGLAWDRWRPQPVAPFWRAFLQSSVPVGIVFSNAIFEGTAQNGMKHWEGGDRLPAAFDDHYTGVGEVAAVQLIAGVLREAGQPFWVKRSLLVNWEDAKHASLIFVGSPKENKILRELPRRQDFAFQPDPVGGFQIVNRAQLAGEETAYRLQRTGPSTREITECYGLISRWEGLDQKRILVLAGLTTLGTQAAAEYATRPAYAAELGEVDGSFQILVHVLVSGGVPVRIRRVAMHRAG